jgi:IclR family transcriptional regulator, acetate operon repressor
MLFACAERRSALRNKEAAVVDAVVGKVKAESVTGELGLDGADRRYRVHSVVRALAALEALAESGPEGLSLSDVAREIETSKSTALALLRTLAAPGYVSALGSGRAKRYRLGLALARLGDQVLSQVSVLDVALPYLREMTAETGWTSRIGVLDDGYAVIVGRADAPGIVQFQSNLARRELPHCSAVGKALLSHLPETTVREIVGRTGLPARTGTTITDVEALLRDLDQVRKSGFAVDDEEDNDGVVCLGASVLDHRSSCVAAVSLTGLKHSLPPGGMEPLAQVVRRYAAEISASLGAPELAV